MGASVLNPSSHQEGDTRTPESASAELGKSASRLSHTSPKSPQVRGTVGEVNHHQLGAGDPEEGGRPQKTPSGTENLTQLSGSNTNIPNVEPSCRSTAEEGRYVEPKVEHEWNPESSPAEQDRLNRDDNCGLRGQKSLDTMEQKQKKKKNKKEVKAAGARKQELR